MWLSDGVLDETSIPELLIMRLSVCLCVDHLREPCQSGATDRDEILRPLTHVSSKNRWRHLANTMDRSVAVAMDWPFPVLKF